MSVWIDRKYLGFVSHRLEKFKQKKTDLYNFRCPFCGDSRKNKLKTRGFVYRKANDYFYRCFNCSKSTTFGKFLQEIDGSVYKQYSLERYAGGETKHHNYKKPDFSELRGNAFSKFEENVQSDVDEHMEVDQSNVFKKWNETDLQNIENLPDGHYAREYIKSRRIPKKFWNEIYFAPAFRDFLDTQFPDHGKDSEQIPNDDRIVLFYTNEIGEVTNVAGRALSDTKIRYITIKIKDEKKIFGLHRMQKENRIYVFEGQFDSFFIENSVASGDSNLGSIASLFPELDIVLVYDREPRNKDIVKQIQKSIDNNYKVCLFPDSVKEKDVNEMIQNDLTPGEIKDIIDSNTFSGLAAKLNFTHWKRC